MKVYAVFHLRGPDIAPELCSLHCTLAQAKKTVLAHPPIGEGAYLGVLAVPLYGFPWLILTLGAMFVIGLELWRLL